MWASLLLTICLVSASITPQASGIAASSWSDASTWTVLSSTDGGGRVSYTCSLVGSLTSGASTCTTVTRTGSPPEGVIAALGSPGYGILPFQTWWGMWLAFGCDAEFNDSLRCRAIRYFVGFNVFAYVLLSLVVVVGITGLLQLSEALFQMHFAPESEIVALRPPNLWRFTYSLVICLAFVVFSWPLVIVAALLLLKQETKVAADLSPVDGESTLVRPGASWWFCFFSLVIMAYAALVQRELEKRLPHPEANCRPFSLCCPCCARASPSPAPPQAANNPAFSVAAAPGEAIPAWPPQAPEPTEKSV